VRAKEREREREREKERKKRTVEDIIRGNKKNHVFLRKIIDFGSYHVKILVHGK